MRVRSIDVFRGLGIVSMVFFTMLTYAGNDLPGALSHNMPDSIHIGDFVLPIFLFASGMSLVFFERKRAQKKKLDYALDVAERMGKLAIVWAFISPFSSGELFGMDELILSVILFVPSLALARFDDKIIALAALAPIIAYLALFYASSLPDFSGHYLGGFAAAPFYLPVMLAGVIAGKRMDDAGALPILASLAAFATIALALLVPPYKAIASPSFMALSIFISLALFALIRKLGDEKVDALGYLGRDPLRFWILMFVALIIPMGFYFIGTKTDNLGLGWPAALALSAFSVAFLYAASKLLDRLALALNALRP